MGRRPSRAATGWWNLTGWETCAVCAAPFDLEVESRCADCDAPLCPLCVVEVVIRRRLCPACFGASR